MHITQAFLKGYWCFSPKVREAFCLESIARARYNSSQRELDEIPRIKGADSVTWGPWGSYNITTLLKRSLGVLYARERIGVYELADESKETVYYGSGQVKARLLDHLNKKECPSAKFYRVEYCSTETECKTKEQQLLEAYKKEHNGQLPIYNKRPS